MRNPEITGAQWQRFGIWDAGFRLMLLTKGFMNRNGVSILGRFWGDYLGTLG